MDGLVSCLQLSQPISIVSPPGTGKTTTLVQLTEKILTAEQNIAVLIQLGEWSDRDETFFQFLVRHSAFCSFQVQHFMQVAYHGRLILILDGWNELNPKSRLRAQRDISALQREFPQLGIVVSTRQQTLFSPGITVEIEPLSNTQQIKIASKTRGKIGENLVKQAWNIPGLRELISIPLYLTALLNSSHTEKLPQTKEEILRILVAQHEMEPDKIEILKNELLGFSKEFLTSLAVQANYKSTTTLSDKDARIAIGKKMDDLLTEHQLTKPLQAPLVLETLVNTHSLVRIYNTGSISFQHQQIQEWYASLEVERLILNAAHNEEDRKVLQIEIINWLSWEESILFACERLSRKGIEGTKVVGLAIINTLEIDPMLAAEMIFRSGQEVWSLIKDKVLGFVRRWHKSGTVDRAVRFMISSGRADFSEFIWALLNNSNKEIPFQTLEISPIFRPSVLGIAEKPLKELPEGIRGNVLSKIVQSGPDGIELVANLAKKGQSAQVIVKIVQALYFRKADELIREILKEAPNEVWQLIADKEYPDKFEDELLTNHLSKAQQALINNEADPIRVLNYLAKGWLSKRETEERVKQLIQSPDLPLTTTHTRVVLENLFEFYPKVVESALLYRMANKFSLPYKVHLLLKKTRIDEGPIVTVVMDKTTPKKLALEISSILGPKTVGLILDELTLLDYQYNQNCLTFEGSQRDDYWRLRGAILNSPQDSFFEALLLRSNTEQIESILLMLDLLRVYGRSHESQEKIPFEINVIIKQKLTKMLKGWIKTLLKSPNSNEVRYKIMWAIERLPHNQFIPVIQKMLKLTLDEEEVQLAGKSLNKNFDNVTRPYFTALVSIRNERVIALLKNYLSDKRLALNAAAALKQIWLYNNPENQKGVVWGIDYSKVKSLRNLFYSEKISETSEFSEVIFEAIENLDALNTDSSMQILAINLAKIALSMPCGKKLMNYPCFLPFPKNIQLNAFYLL
ncbi:NACHT domain-containing protein [Legionella tunisiensis]|uniref:NACHT domain-containing protein n=1 Tax=Legionella tunisiensis TaxID=1034944 RepID=UPI0002FD9E70|nr:hypothetical protein [Legionella tunisiensis]